MITAMDRQCPHCHADINLSHEPQTESGAKSRCEHCKQSFVTEDSLLISDDHSSFLSEHTTSSSDSTAVDATVDNNMLIHDDMEIDETTDPIIEYDSLEEMNAWLNQVDIAPVKPSNNAVNHDTPPIPKPVDIKDNLHTSSQPTVADKSTHTPDDSLIVPITVSQQPTVAPISSAQANNIHASVSANNSGHTSDNHWLETLLDEQNRPHNSVTNDLDDTDLAQLLIDIGMQSADEKSINKARASKIETRMQSSSTANSYSIPNIIWSAGSVILVLLLLAQYVVFNIDSLVKNPAMATRLQGICSIAACSIPHADISAFTIDKLSYKSSRVQKTSTYTDIQADLVNESAKTQLLPNLKVSIYANDAIIGEFIAQPKNYLLSSESKLPAERAKSVMFTVPVAVKQMTKVLIQPIY